MASPDSPARPTGRFGRGAVLAVMAAAVGATVVVPTSGGYRPGWAAGGAVLLVVLVAVRVALRRRSVTAGAELGFALTFLAVIACWRQADGGSHAGFGALVLLPVLWLALLGLRRHMWVCAAAALVMMGAPLFLVGGSMYPMSSWRVVIVPVAVASLAGALVDRLVADLRTAALAAAGDRARLGNAQRMAGLGSWTSNRETATVWFSDEMYRLLGMAPGQIEPGLQTFASKVDERDRDRYLGLIEHLEPGSALDDTFAVRGSDGTLRWLMVRGRLFTDERGSLRTEGTVLDVTRVRELEQELSSTTERLVRLLDSASDQAVVATDPDGLVTVFSAGAERMTGYAAREVIGRPVTALRDPASIEAGAGTSGRLASGEWECLRKDGTPFTASLTVAALRHAGGVPDGWIGIASDVTAHRRAAEELAASERRFRVAFDSAPCGMALLPASGRPRAGRFLQVNQALCDMVGARRDELVGSHCAALVVPDDVHLLLEAVARFEAGGGDSGEFAARLQRRDGGTLTAQIRYANIDDADGRPLHCVVQFEDVTARVEARRSLEAALEQERVAAERLRELDRVRSDFVSMVSHELRTPLTSIAGYVEMLVDGDGGELPERAAEMLGVVDRNSARLLALIEDLLTLSRIDAHAVEDEIAAVDVTALLRDAVAAVRPLTGRAALRMDVDLDVEGVTLSGDAGQLERVVLNLLGNAIKFTPAGGSVRLSARVTGGSVEIEVRDDGIGIPLAEQPRLFERFFRSSTSKERQIPGTGLGLPIARTIVERHQGSIAVHSAPGAGTTVVVTLPGAMSVGAPVAVPTGAALPATAVR